MTRKRLFPLAALAIILIYPIVFGLTITKIDHRKDILFNAQSLELYIVLVSIIVTIWLSRRDPRAKSGAPYTYIQKFGIALPLSGFVIVVGVMFGFAVFLIGSHV